MAPPSKDQKTATAAKDYLDTLRVADQELSSGNRTGKVYVQLSTGSAAFLTERPVAQTRISRKLRAAIDAAPVVP